MKKLMKISYATPNNATKLESYFPVGCTLKEFFEVYLLIDPTCIEFISIHGKGEGEYLEKDMPVVGAHVLKDGDHVTWELVKASSDAVRLPKDAKLITYTPPYHSQKAAEVRKIIVAPPYKLIELLERMLDLKLKDLESVTINGEKIFRKEIKEQTLEDGDHITWTKVSHCAGD